MDYKTAGGALDRIDEALDYVNQLSILKGGNVLTSNVGAVNSSLGKVNRKVSSINSNLESSKSDIVACMRKLKEIEDTVRGKR